MIKRLLVSSAALCLLNALSFADERVLTTYLGKSTTGDSYLHLRQPGRGTDVMFTGVAFNDKSFVSPFNYGLRYTIFPDSKPWFGYGFDYFHYKVFTDPNDMIHASGMINGLPVERDQRVADTFEHFYIANGVNYFMVNAIVRTRPRISQTESERHLGGSERLRAYAGLGTGPVVVFASSRLNGSSRGGYEYAGMGWQAFGGFEYMLDAKTALFFEGKFTNDSLKMHVAEGTVRTRLSTRHIAIGVNYRH